MLTDEQLQDIQTLLDIGHEMLLWRNHPTDENIEFIRAKGEYGASFFDPQIEDPPECSDDCEYGHSIQEAILNALRRWR
jgi:hypothetical protein